MLRGFRIKEVYRGPDVTYNVCKRVPGHAFRVRRIRTHIAGREETNDSLDGQQSPHMVLPIQEDTTQTVELLRPSSAIRLRPGSSNRSRKPSSRLLSRIDINPKDRIPLKLHDEIPVFKVKSCWLRRHPNRMMTKRGTYLMTPMYLTRQHGTIQQYKHYWRCSQNCVVKTKNSTIYALTTSGLRCSLS